MKKLLLLAVVLLAGPLARAGRQVQVVSPDKRIRFTLDVAPEGIAYDVAAYGRPVIGGGRLGFEFDSGAFSRRLQVGRVERRRIDETYRLIVGKTSEARACANEARIPLVEREAPFRRIDLVVRVFDEGVGFRYEFPEQAGWSAYTMYDELTTFDPAGDPLVLALPLPSYTSTHEGLYTEARYAALPENQLFDMPATFDFGDGLFAAVTEAAVRDYAGMYLCREEGRLAGKLSPLPGRGRVKVVADSLPHRTPWRTVLIGRSEGDLIESDLLTHLNDPCAFDDTSWIAPCKTTFTWWNGNVVPDLDFSPGNNFETNKYYIDFAARHGIDLHGIYGYAETPWYYDDGFNFGWPGPHADATRPIPCLQMERIADYARGKGVGLHLWVHWKALYERLDEAMALYERWGVRGMMVDFMDRDDQEMIRIQERILRAAGRHRIFIQFHGASKPSGLHRTYPNEFTREGTLNYEVCKWARQVTPDHDVSIPFARMLAGAADYHLGGFRAVRRADFEPHYVNPTVVGTRCHMLAMYVVLENYLGSLCDNPMAYEGAPGFEFLTAVPQTWDRTHVAAARLNRYVAVARRSGEEWYLGAITNREARELEIDLGFLGEGRYRAEMWLDESDPEADQNRLVRRVSTVGRGDRLVLPLAADGGAAVRFVPER